jgi:serine/threonine protein kinase
MKFTYPSGSRPLDGYTIKRGVGRGGFGEVYFATSDAGKEVALKLIRRNLEVELRGVTQCLNLKHPNLIALYDIRTDEMGDQWVIMEYVSGESLEEVIERNPNGVPLEQALWWMRGICSGVSYLHDHGIVHRDLKPGNIFSDEGVVKIGDYGLAKFISCSRRSGQTESVGTVHYMAPEIANGRYGREIDTYALGIILFEMLTGRVPFEGESVGEVLMKHAGDRVFQAVEHARKVTHTLRESFDAQKENEFLTWIRGLDVATATQVIRAFTLYFQLVNLAEEVHRIRRKSCRNRLVTRRASYAHENAADSLEETGERRRQDMRPVRRHPTRGSARGQQAQGSASSLGQRAHIGRASAR